MKSANDIDTDKHSLCKGKGSSLIFTDEYNWICIM